MRLLLDTHVLLWWHNEPSRLSETANDAISDLDNETFLSVVNGWEVQIKAQLGKLTLSQAAERYLGAGAGYKRFQITSYDDESCLCLGSLSPASPGSVRPSARRSSSPRGDDSGNARSEVIGLPRTFALVAGLDLNE